MISGERRVRIRVGGKLYGWLGVGGGAYLAVALAYGLSCCKRYFGRRDGILSEGYLLTVMIGVLTQHADS